MSVPINLKYTPASNHVQVNPILITAVFKSQWKNVKSLKHSGSQVCHMYRTTDTLFGNVDWWYFLSLSQISMSSSFPTRDIEPEDQQAFSIFLTVYLKVKKLVKIKELFFAIKLSNLGYIDFLKSMLQKHGQEDYEVTKKKHYPFWYTLPKVKGYIYVFSRHTTWMTC